jgi:hypothetical protein
MKPVVAPWAVSLVVGMGSVALAAPFDHLDCRRVRDPGPRRRVRAELLARDASLAAPADCTLILPARYLCTAAEVLAFHPEPAGLAEGPEAQGYLCYRARCAHDGQEVAVRDAFGDRTVVVRGTSLVCAPLGLPDGSETTTTTVPTSTTTLPPASTTSTAPPSTSTSSTTTTSSSTTTMTPSTSSTTTTSSSTTTTTLAVPEPPSPGCPVVNEVMTGSMASASEELVEILNACPGPIALDGARLLYQSASGATQRTLVVWEAGAVLEPGARLVYATSQYVGPVDGSFAAGLSGTGGGVGLVDAGEMAIDGVGWGTAVNAFVEGTVAPAPSAGSVIARIPDGSDTDDGGTDWQETSPTPGLPND